MVTIPAGEFMMGGANNRSGDTDALAANTLPVHHVKLDAFKIGKYEVTVKEFRQFVEATGYQMPDTCNHQPTEGWFDQGATPGSWSDNELTSSDFQPVVCINWKIADDYANWLAKVTGKNYRLVSEAEWEYVAKGGQETKFYFGDDAEQTQICEFDNVSDKTAEQYAQKDYGATYNGFMGGTTQCDDQSGYASIVGMYKANPYGVFDLHGNVIEYIKDCYHENYTGAPSDGSAWVTEKCEARVFRGSAWHWRGMSTKTRFSARLDWVGVLEGFRLAQGISPKDNNKKSTATVLFEKSLLQVQNIEKKRRQQILPYPEKVTGLQMTEDMTDGSIKLSWNKNSESSISGYHIYRTESVGSDYIKIASNIKKTTFTDKSAPSRKHSYVVAAVNPDNFGEQSEPITTSDMVNDIPGIVQVEDYNNHNGVWVGVIREEENAGGGLNLTGRSGVAEGLWTEYLINVESSGTYQFSASVASLEGSNGFQFFINGQKKSMLKVPATGGYRKWKTILGDKIKLSAGEHMLKMEAITSGSKINWLSFESIE